MSRANRYALLNRVRRDLRARGLTDREIADLVVDAARQRRLIDDSKFLTGQQLDLLCRPSSGKSVNKWVTLGAFDVFERYQLASETDIEQAVLEECRVLAGASPEAA